MSTVHARAPGGHVAPEVCRGTRAGGGVKLPQPLSVDQPGSPQIAERLAVFTEHGAPEPRADLLHRHPARKGKDR